MAYGDDRNELATDAFTDDPFSSRFENGGGSWSAMAYDGTPDVVQAGSAYNHTTARRDTGEDWTEDQYVTVTFEGATTWQHELGCCVRMKSGTDESAYVGITQLTGLDDYEIWEMDSAFSFNMLATASPAIDTYAAGDTMTMECEGTALRFGSNESGGGDTQRVSTTDATITAGDPGMYMYIAWPSDLSECEYSDFAAGSIGVLGGVVRSLVGGGGMVAEGGMAGRSGGLVG